MVNLTWFPFPQAVYSLKVNKELLKFSRVTTLPSIACLIHSLHSLPYSPGGKRVRNFPVGLQISATISKKFVKSITRLSWGQEKLWKFNTTLLIRTTYRISHYLLCHKRWTCAWGQMWNHPGPYQEASPRSESVQKGKWVQRYGWQCPSLASLSANH